MAIKASEPTGVVLQEPAGKTGTPEIVLRGYVGRKTAYGQHTESIARALIQLGYSVGIVPINASGMLEASADLRHICHPEGLLTPSFEVQISPPTVAPVHSRCYWWTMHESTVWSEDMLKNLSKAAMILLPSTFNHKTLMTQGYWPVAIVPMGIDTSVFHFRRWRRGSSLRFLVAGRHVGAGCRKQPELAVKEFGLAFPAGDEKVSLTVKLFPDCTFNIEFLDPRIRVIREDMDARQLADLYAAHDCYVNVSKGEAWGLIPHQMAATGRAVMTGDRDGVKMHQENFHKIETSWKPVVESETYYTGRQLHYAEGSVAEAYKRVYAQWLNPNRRGDFSDTFGAKAAAGFSWQNSAAVLAGILETNGLIPGY